MTYSTIVIDPPWPERGAGKIKRGADRHYPLLNVREMPRVILSAPCWRPADNAHLYLWTTNNYLPDALWLVSALGFTYKTLITWAKDRPGLGQYFRGMTEHMLFATRGSGVAVRTEHKDLSTLIIAPRGKHSAKPDTAYYLVEQRSLGPYLEMFARDKRDGWDVWGNEVNDTITEEREHFEKLLQEGRELRDATRKHVEPMLTLSPKARNLILE